MSALDAADFGFLSETARYDFFLRLYRSPTPADAGRLEGLYSSADPLIPLILLQYLEDLPERAAVAAIVRQIENRNEIVARAAMAAYRRNHSPSKARMLKQLILSTSDRACRFAVRTLSRAGFVEALPLILRELPDREGAVRAEMIEALRFLPDRRCAPVLLPLASSSDEPTRFLALQVLADIQARVKILPVTFFMKKAQDPSERVRRAALEALQRFPSKRVAPMIFEAAFDEAAPEESRLRAVAALQSFPSPELVRPLTALTAASDSPTMRLAAETALRGLPREILRGGLMPLLKDGRADMRRQAALLLADQLGDDPGVRRALLRLWDGSSESDALALVDAVRALGGPDGERALRTGIEASSALAYASATALARMRGAGRGAAVLALAADKSRPDIVRQALLDRFARRGPDDPVREELLPVLLECLASDNTNIRYLGARGLAWYPLEKTLAGLVDLLAEESVAEVTHTTVSQIVKGLGRDPMPLVRAVLGRPRSPRLTARVVQILLSQGWDPARADELLDALAAEPGGLFKDRPAPLFAVLIHMLEHGSVGLPRLWPVVGGGRRLELFLRMLSSSLRRPLRRFPPLPLEPLAARMAGMPAPARVLYYGVLAADGRDEAVACLTGALLREPDDAARARGATLLRRLLEEPPR